MMTRGRAKEITKAIKRHDRKLYAEMDSRGVIHIYRESFQHMAYDVAGALVNFLVAKPHYVFSLTDNWTLNGKPREWGVEVVYERIREMDTWGHSDPFERLKKDREKAEASRERHLQNETEAFLYDARSEFKKAFSDVNTALMSKDNPRKRLRDRRIKNGSS